MVEEAAWLTRLKEGDPSSMDDFLVSIGLGLRQMAGLPDPNELLADAPYDYRRAKEVRCDRGRARRGTQAERIVPRNSGHGEEVMRRTYMVTPDLGSTTKKEVLKARQPDART